jgi:type III secretory pathway component EscS
VLPHALELTRQALFLTVWLSLPALGVCALVGVIMGLVGSASQVNDPAVAHLPRVLAVSLVVFALGGAGAATLVHFTHQLWQAIPTLVR